MDSFHLRVRKTSREIAGERSASWLEVDVEINGRSLVDLVRDVESRYAAAEGTPDLAGAYLGLPASMALSRHFLGKSSDGIGSSEHETKVPVLMCECGVDGCWDLVARIEVHDDVVRWSEFEQPHRVNWSYDALGPFVFDRAEYEEQLVRARQLR